MRLFIAINFNEETRTKLITLRDGLQKKSTQGSFALSDNIHLTLAFLGECDSTQLEAAKSAMNTMQFAPFDLEIERVGRFKRDSGDIWWAGVQKSKPLLSLQRDLSNALRSVGFKLENRKYSPHVTLGRKIITVEKLQEIKPFGETVYKIDLMKSERSNGILTYTCIYRRGKKANPIIVESYNPKWPTEFKRIEDFLLPHIGDLVIQIHHVGSTSVEGLAAKPIIDFDIEISDMSSFPQIKKRLEDLGYKHEGNYGIEGREAFKRKTKDDFMAYHMYVCPSSSEELNRHIRFRDSLRKNPDAVAEYGTLKMNLAAKYVDDIDAYIDGKTSFIQKIL
ncbi:MAG: RNA 2',3'-cyclic phosphodiesterase [Defluviitaleaceae bacterium]|nr:RNA 2',3'-cyclic phosphodiesterase [Defluviitaleaceae bacterium]